MGKARDLWSSEDGTKSINRPQPVRIAKKWTVTPEVLPAKSEAPRRRKLAPIRPNNRPAVPVPLAGQSYNPTDEDHQEGMRIAVRQLEKKKKAHTKFVQQLTLGRDKKINDGVSEGANWEEEVQEFKEKKKRTLTEKQIEKKASLQRKKEKKMKKLGKHNAEKERRHSFARRRHPNLETNTAKLDKIDELIAELDKKKIKSETKRIRRREAKKENTQVKHYGRHYHTPLVVDVASSEQLVGSLRHLSGGNVHPAMERLKSLEERNLIPARMRHTYNKRRVLKPKGEVRVKRESFGVTPETTF